MFRGDAMEVKKVFLASALLLLLAVSLYIGADCVRLNRSEVGTRPFITFAAELTESQVVYHGLGYSVRYYVSPGDITREEDMEKVGQFGYGGEFRLLDSLLLWAWIE